MVSVIERFISIAPSLVDKYTMDNKGTLPKRFAFNGIRNEIDSIINCEPGQPRILVISGLRGVGKTTVLMQIFKDLLDEGWDPDRLVYLTMDQAVFSGKSIRDLIEEYQEIILHDYFVNEGGQFVFFIDEAHYSPNWDLELKTTSDEAPNCTFIVSGSSALHLGMSADLARRSIKIGLDPLSYLEFLCLNKRKTIDPGILSPYKKVLFESKDIKDIDRNYPDSVKDINQQLRKMGGNSPGSMRQYLLSGGMPWSFARPSYQRLYDVIQRIIERDIPRLGEHDSQTLRNIPKILGMLAPSPDTSLNSITRDLDRVSITSVSRVVDTLVKSKLIFEIPHFGGMRSSIRRETRKYFTSPCLAAAIIDAIGSTPEDHIGSLTECAVASSLFRLSQTESGINLFYHAGKGQADFVIDHKKNRIVIEVGSGRKDDGFIQVKKTMKETGSKMGLIISDVNTMEKRGYVMRIPLKEFLCL